MTKASAGQLLTGSSQNIVCNASTSTAAALPFGPQTQRVRVVATAPVNYRVDAGTPVAVASDALLGVKPEYITVAPGQRIAGLGNATINVTELDAAPLAPSWVLNGDGIYASVDLNFQTGQGYNAGISASAASLVTTARASTAMVDDASGNWTSFAANAPRITNKGLLVEEARTQLLGNTNAVNWALVNVTQTANQLGPDGGTAAWSVTDDGTSNPHYAYWSPNIPGSGTATTYTVSAFFKYGTSRYMQAILGSGGFGQNLYVNVDLVAGVVTQAGGIGTGTTFSNSGITVYPNGWIRVWATGSLTIAGPIYPAVAPIPNGTMLPGTVYTGTGVGSAVWTPQVEAATFPTSPIPNTSGGSFARAADAITLTTIPTPTTYNPMAIVVYGQSTAITETSAVFGGWAAATGFSDSVYLAPTGPNLAIAAIVGGTATIQLSDGALVSPFKVAASLATNSSNVVSNGTVATRDTTHSPTAAAITAVTIGSASWSPGSNVLNGYITRFALIRNSVSDAGLVNLTH